MKNFLRSYKKLSLHAKVYPLKAVVNACYSLIDKYYFYLDIPKSTPNKILVYFRLKKTNRNEISVFGRELMDALLHAVLRLQLSKSNKRIREYIVGSALYSHLSVSGQESFLGGSSEGKLDDPLEIGVPWEKKYAAKKNRSRP